MLTNGKLFDKVYWIMLENHGWSQVQNCKFVDYISKHGTVFTKWYATCHPSGPNYRTCMSGNWWSYNEFDNVKRPNIADHVPVHVVNYEGTPAERHNPFLDMHSTQVVNTPEEANIVYLGMDDENDAHSGSLEVADNNVMSAITNTHLHEREIMFVMFDEAFGWEWFNNHIFVGCLGEDVTVQKISDSLNHKNFANLLYWNWDLPIPEESKGAVNFDWTILFKKQ